MGSLRCDHEVDVVARPDTQAAPVCVLAARAGEDGQHAVKSRIPTVRNSIGSRPDPCCFEPLPGERRADDSGGVEVDVHVQDDYKA